MTNEKKYKEGEKFFEVTFEIPIGRLTSEKIAESVMNCYPDSCNIRVIPCEIVKEPPRLSVSKDDYCVTRFNAKEKSQIIKS